MTARPFALVRAHAATLDGPLGDDLRALLATWDAEHPGAVGERYLASVGDSVWTVTEERGDDFVLRGERGESWEVSRDYLAAEVRAGRMRLADGAAPVRVCDVLLHGGLRWAVSSVAPRCVTLSRPGGASWELEPDALAAMLAAGEMQREAV